jgi:uncharacterized membrane protein
MLDNSLEKVPTPTGAPGQAVATNGAPNAELLTRKLERAGISGDVIQLIKMEVTRSHIGPLPTVETYEGYERVCPGSAREILDMAVRQQKHGNDMERYNAHSEFWLPVIGICAAVSIVVAMFTAGIYLALNGHEHLAIGVLTGTGIATVVGTVLQRGKTEDPAPTPPPRPTGKFTRRERRERAAQARKNLINR